MSLAVAQLDSGIEACESRLEGVRYFIVGLSNGVTEDGDQLYLPLDNRRYIADVDAVTLFDGPALQFIGENGCMPDEDSDGWEQACCEMEERVSAIAMDLGKEVQIMKSSDVCASDPAEFSRIYKAVIQAIWDDPWVADKIWQIAPPSVKIPNGFDTKAKFSSLSKPEQARAVELIKYEVIHIAFILFSRGEKVLHGRSEERSLQIVKRLQPSVVPDWQGGVRDPKELQAKRLFGSCYPNPYALHSIEDARDVFKVIVEEGQVPLRATLQLAEAMRWYVENGQEGAMRGYLERNGCGEMLLDFSKTENIYLSAAAITSSVVWRVEKGRVTPDRVPRKVLDVIDDLCLSPDLEVILKDLMPRFCGRLDKGGVAESIKFLLENVPSAIAGLPNEYERQVMGSVIGILRDLYAIVGGNLDGVQDSGWFQTALNVDTIFNDGRFGALMGQVGLEGSSEARDEAVEDLLGCKAGIELADRVSSSSMMLMWAGSYADRRRFKLSDSSVYYLFKLMVKYLAVRGDADAFQILKNGWVDLRMWVVMSWDDISKRYSEARALELGLSRSDMMFASCDAVDEMGMTQNPAMRGVIEANRAFAKTYAEVVEGRRPSA